MTQGQEKETGKSKRLVRWKINRRSGLTGQLISETKSWAEDMEGACKLEGGKLSAKEKGFIEHARQRIGFYAFSFTQQFDYSLPENALQTVTIWQDQEGGENDAE